ncbi:MAG: cytochrome c-type biogenesis protein CcmH [Anaerolineales bacterium]|jgi:cytochrome c-type biogenesis protein CcmH
MKQRYHLWLAVSLALFISLVAASAAVAQDSSPRTPTDDQVNAIAKQLYCPVCENIPLDVCGTQACEQWRGLIREKLAAGWDEAQIKQYFVDQFGDRVLATPPARGLNWLVYIIPPVAILAGVYVIYRALMAWKQPVDELPYEQESAPNNEDEYITRLEEELRSRQP